MKTLKSKPFAWVTAIIIVWAAIAAFRFISTGDPTPSFGRIAGTAIMLMGVFAIHVFMNTAAKAWDFVTLTPNKRSQRRTRLAASLTLLGFLPSHGSTTSTPPRSTALPSHATSQQGNTPRFPLAPTIFPVTYAIAVPRGSYPTPSSF